MVDATKPEDEDETVKKTGSGRAKLGLSRGLPRYPVRGVIPDRIGRSIAQGVHGGSRRKPG